MVNFIFGKLCVSIGGSVGGLGDIGCGGLSSDFYVWELFVFVWF